MKKIKHDDTNFVDVELHGKEAVVDNDIKKGADSNVNEFEMDDDDAEQKIDVVIHSPTPPPPQPHPQNPDSDDSSKV